MLHPDLMLWLARLRFRELWNEAERVRQIRLSRRAHEPVAVPPGLERILRLKSEKREAWADLQKLVGRIEAHPRWSAHPREASNLRSALDFGARLGGENSADDRQLSRDLLHLNSERARLARVWCRLEGLLPDSPAGDARVETPTALGR